MAAGVYKITIGKRFYYGKSVNLAHRRRQHLSLLRNNCHPNQFLQNAFRKHGHMKWEVVAECDEDYIGRLEHELVSLCAGNPCCMNLAQPDCSGGYRHSDESRSRMSRVKKGKVFTEDHKEKLRQRNVARCGKACVIITPGGFPMLFESAADAAEALGVGSRVLLHYLQKRYPWPTTSRKSSLVGYTGFYA